MIIHFHQNFEICKNEKSSKKKHTQILKIEVETGIGFLAAETYSFSLKNTWFQNIDYFFKLTSDDPLPLAQYISWYMFMKKIFSHGSFLQNHKIFDFVYVFILEYCKNNTKFQLRWRRWATQLPHNLMHLKCGKFASEKNVENVRFRWALPFWFWWKSHISK